MDKIEDIHARVRKLLRLAAGSPSEAEASLAAARAAELMQAHGLHEAELSIAEPGQDHRPSPTVTQYADATQGATRISPWKFSVIGGAAAAFGCRWWYSGSQAKLFGRQADVQAADYTITWLCGEIERLCEAAADKIGAPGAAWRASFRIGAASVVQVTLHEQGRKREEARHTTLARAGVADTIPKRRHTPALNAVVEPVTDTALVPSRAMILAAQLEQEVEDEYELLARKMFGRRRGRSISRRVSSLDGYSAGQKAGRSISIGAARAGIGPGLPRLK